jgi:hypothetical protein
VIILVDSGSTHNFVDATLAAMLAIVSTSGDAINVRIANGQIISSPRKSQDLTLKMQGHFYKMDSYILPLAGCDIVLGIQWLRVLGPILWDFDHLTMEFQYGSKRCVLQGLQQGPHLSLEDGKAFKWLKKGSKGVMFQIMPAELQAGEEIQKSDLLGDILEEYLDVFKEPTELPPRRAHDHAIPLQQGVQPISVRPYRYHFYQKKGD